MIFSPWHDWTLCCLQFYHCNGKYPSVFRGRNGEKNCQRRKRKKWVWSTSFGLGFLNRLLSWSWSSCSPFCPQYKNKNLLEYKIFILAFQIKFKFSVIKYTPFFENSFSQILRFDYKRIWECLCSTGRIRLKPFMRGW